MVMQPNQRRSREVLRETIEVKMVFGIQNWKIIFRKVEREFGVVSEV
jgi:hypothetical protein